MLRPEAPPLEPVPESERLSHDRPVVALVAPHGRDAALEALARGVTDAGRRVVTLRVGLRASAGAQHGAGVVHTDRASACGAVREALARLPAHDLVVVEGALGVELVRAALACAIVESEASFLHGRDLRVVRARLDLVLFEPRPQLLAKVAGALSTSTGGRGLVASGA